jgi:beta-glucosidase-like glycosyl hydrolase
VVAYLDSQAARRGAILPVYNMVDRRRSMHLAALAANPNWPVIPMASAIEALSGRSEGVGVLPQRSPAAVAIAALWEGIERRLARIGKGS